MLGLKWFGITAVLALAGSACAQEIPTAEEAQRKALRGAGGGISLRDELKTKREGNAITIPLDVSGIEIVAADGDTSGQTGHFHVFIDREPLAVGEVIPREEGIVHTADNPVKLYGLPIGEHKITIVVGDGTHTRIREDLELGLDIEIEGPFIGATAPATIAEGDDLEIEFEVEGVEIVPADGDDSGETGHIHVLVDPIEPPEEGEPIPDPVPNEVIHTTDDSVTITDLAKGEHTIWVVVGDGNHVAFDPAVIDRVTVTVQ